MKKILIVDDDLETLDLLDRILRKNFSIKTVSSADTLSSDLYSYQPDLIIIDHFIGFQTSNEIITTFKTQEQFKHIPVIIHSGHEQIENIARDTNADGFIKKPASITYIRTYIEHKLGFTAA